MRQYAVVVLISAAIHSSPSTAYDLVMDTTPTPTNFNDDSLRKLGREYGRGMSGGQVRDDDRRNRGRAKRPRAGGQQNNNNAMGAPLPSPGTFVGIATDSWRLLLLPRPTDVGRSAGVRAAFFMYLCAGQNQPNNEFWQDFFWVVVVAAFAVGAGAATSSPWK
jgi:hypothetical protein